MTRLGSALLFSCIALLSTSSAFSQEKRQPLTVQIKLPPAELITENNDFSGYLETVKIPDINHRLNKRDAATLIGLIIQIHRQLEQHPKLKSTIKKDCDILKTLASNFHDLNILIQITEGQSIEVSSASKLLEPYFAGAKEYPAHIK
ncbi:hypothetical protein SAMN02745181_1432 [Rubritalea squalenifaciens DSM 18772]|uniref:Uncharacterized protein n=1 Tax=Rubritalea squalenifaciens DSM 18772 TaxID=1123071 RepID=A0A1M6HBW8_9BACT|nr:hypothetical protein [Rubritalea squalenifaciens]SHJ19737.1 hypothetical protein SAMN02745181_1432 [Rubritalea squalenifaciens DSM 18772]